MSLYLGCIADDFTGATDLANILVGEGMRTTLCVGVSEGVVSESEAVGLVDYGVVEGGVEAIGERMAALVAEGETAGAAVQALGVEALRIGPQIDPGVPWCLSLDERGLFLALKSGNFGGEDFMTRAFEVLR